MSLFFKRDYKNLYKVHWTTTVRGNRQKEGTNRVLARNEDELKTRMAAMIKHKYKTARNIQFEIELVKDGREHLIDYGEYQYDSDDLVFFMV